MFSLFKLFENKENTFSYGNQIKTNCENKENEFIIFIYESENCYVLFSSFSN